MVPLYVPYLMMLYTQVADVLLTRRLSSGIIHWKQRNKLNSKLPMCGTCLVFICDHLLIVMLSGALLILVLRNLAPASIHL